MLVGGDSVAAYAVGLEVFQCAPSARETFSPVVKDMGDEELVARVAQGDERAFSELYDRYARPIYATGIRLLQDARLAEELVRDAFTNLWRGSASFDPERESFATWLYRLTRNRAEYLNHGMPFSSREEPLGRASGVPEPAGVLDLWVVAEALSFLSPEHRRVLNLAYFEGLSQREISQRTGVPLETVKGRITSALKELRRAIEANSAGESRRG